MNQTVQVSHAATCGLGTQVIESGHPVTGMTLCVGCTLSYLVVLCAKGFPSWRANYLHDR